MSKQADPPDDELRQLLRDATGASPAASPARAARPAKASAPGEMALPLDQVLREVRGGPVSAEAPRRPGTPALRLTAINLMAPTIKVVGRALA